jgi:hypothetical protein
MKRFAVFGALVILLLAGLGISRIRKSGNNGAEGRNINSSFHIDSINFSMSKSELQVNGEKTGFGFPVTDSKDVEVRLGNSIVFKDGHPDITFSVTIKSEQPRVLTREACEKIQTSMTYPQVAEALGGVMTKGRMTDGFWSKLELIQGKHRIYLTFEDSKVTEKSAQDLE